jgi:GT2 family glycosyltransferase
MTKFQFVNHNNHTIQLPDKNGRMQIFAKGQKIVLDEWFKRYVPKHLSMAQAFSSEIGVQKTQIKPITTKHPKIIVHNPKQINPKQNRPKKEVKTIQIGAKRTVGRASHLNRTSATLFSVARLKENEITISNDIGVGILSYNRLESLMTLIESIRKFTDLKKTTIFVSDESTDGRTWDWLKSQTDIVPIHNERIGIAGNTNRLFRCLKRFKYKLLLNDDVEVLKYGWDRFYFEVMNKTGLKHFCYRQSGVYGAIRPNPSNNGVITVSEKPHGAVMAIHDDAFKKVGFMDEEFGIYGFEHVDYSDRIIRSGLTPAGYHDYIGSDSFFKVYNDKSTVDKSSFKEAQNTYNRKKNDSSRIYVGTSAKTIVPAMSCVIPFRDTGRAQCLELVVQNIKSQKYPEIQIVVVEQDETQKINLANFPCIDYYFDKNKFNNQQFCKSSAFNLGVVKSINNQIILHDADMIVRSDYFKMMNSLFENYEGMHIGATVCYLDNDSTNNIIADKYIDENKIASDRVVSYYEGGSLGIKKDVYIRIGGFDEQYIGYGYEDCDFFWRLSEGTKFYNTRSIDLFHTYHGRSIGWGECHSTNILIGQKSKLNGLEREIIRLNSELKSKYKI